MLRRVRLLRSWYKLMVLMARSDGACVAIADFGLTRRGRSRGRIVSVGDAAGPDGRVSAVSLDDGEGEEEDVEAHN